MNIPLDQQNIISILGIEDLDDERKAEMIERASELVQKRLLVRVLESLSKSQQDEFEQVVDKNDPTALGEFLAKNVPNFAEWLVEEVNKLKQEFADISAKAE
jgi:hypothetical protein